MSWLTCRTPRPDAKMPLVCFAHSGGSLDEYLRWGDRMTNVEVWGIQLPGRGARIAEDPFHAVAPLVAAIATSATFPASFALFGHGLGALLAFEVACAMRDRGLPGPRRLFVSGLPAPHLSLGAEPTADLDDASLLASLSGADRELAAELRVDPDRSALVLPALRADLTLVETYRPRGAAPLACPIVAIGGEDDAVARDQLAAWELHTTGRFELHHLPGGHFYFRPDPDPLFALIERGRPG